MTPLRAALVVAVALGAAGAGFLGVVGVLAGSWLLVQGAGYGSHGGE